MIEELIYTSAPQGLKAGSKGFCTVASTAGMAANLVSLLESLSGYRHLAEPGSSNSAQNPVVYSHLKVRLGGRSLQILSRIADAGLDYSGRSNKLAHHIVLSSVKLPTADPATIQGQAGFHEVSWSDEPHLIDRPRVLPSTNVDAAVCRYWQEVTGDAGWGGALAERLKRSKDNEQWIIVPLGVDPLRLLQESLALLPAAVRWQVTYTTFYTKLPPGIDCRVRFAVDGTPEAAQLRKRYELQVLDLCSNLGSAPEGTLTTAARTGTLPEVAEPQMKPEAIPDEDEVVLVDDNCHDVELADVVSVPPPLPSRLEVRVQPKVLTTDDKAERKSAWLLAGALAAMLFISAVSFAVYHGFSTDWFSKVAALLEEQSSTPEPESKEIKEPVAKENVLNEKAADEKKVPQVIGQPLLKPEEVADQEPSPSNVKEEIKNEKPTTNSSNTPNGIKKSLTESSSDKNESNHTTDTNIDTASKDTVLVENTTEAITKDVNPFKNVIETINLLELDENKRLTKFKWRIPLNSDLHGSNLQAECYYPYILETQDNIQKIPASTLQFDYQRPFKLCTSELHGTLMKPRMPELLELNPEGEFISLKLSTLGQQKRYRRYLSHCVIKLSVTSEGDSETHHCFLSFRKKNDGAPPFRLLDDSKPWKHQLDSRELLCSEWPVSDTDPTSRYYLRFGSASEIKKVDSDSAFPHLVTFGNWRNLWFQISLEVRADYNRPNSVNGNFNTKLTWVATDTTPELKKLTFKMIRDWIIVANAFKKFCNNEELLKDHSGWQSAVDILRNGKTAEKEALLKGDKKARAAVQKRFAELDKLHNNIVFPDNFDPKYCLEFLQRIECNCEFGSELLTYDRELNDHKKVGGIIFQSAAVHARPFFFDTE